MILRRWSSLQDSKSTSQAIILQPIPLVYTPELVIPQPVDYPRTSHKLSMRHGGRTTCHDPSRRGKQNLHVSPTCQLVQLATCNHQRICSRPFAYPTLDLPEAFRLVLINFPLPFYDEAKRRKLARPIAQQAAACGWIVWGKLDLILQEHFGYRSITLSHDAE